MEAAKWPKGLKVAVNLSPAQFRFGNVRQAVITALGASQLLPQRLELEVTESLLLEEGENVAETLEKLHLIGVRFAARRLRHRVLVAELSRPLPLRQDQDRPDFHQGAR